jgi:hypothetical protein
MVRTYQTILRTFWGRVIGESEGCYGCIEQDHVLPVEMGETELAGCSAAI